MTEEPGASAGDERLDGGQQPAEAVKQGDTATPEPEKPAGEQAGKTAQGESSKVPEEKKAPAKVQSDESEDTATPTQPVDAGVRAKNALINPQFYGSVSFQDGSGKLQLSATEPGLPSSSPQGMSSRER
ncbi:hypothetical protein [Kribbella sp. C-35]|uniref:hypothetical protein n=1 Tax=Kribbella sp. C-35 TaxID=2789276 RepID=UPI00397ADFBE